MHIPMGRGEDAALRVAREGRAAAEREVERLRAEVERLAAEDSRLRAQSDIDYALLRKLDDTAHEHFELVGRPMPRHSTFGEAALCLPEELERLRAEVDELRPYRGLAGRLKAECTALGVVSIEMGMIGGYYVWLRGRREGPFLTFEEAFAAVRSAAGLGPAHQLKEG